jgi:hypothetical protein
MKLSAYERETIILFNETSEPVEVFTYNKKMIRKLERLAKMFPDEFRLKSDNRDGGMTYIVPKNRILISTPKRKTATE